MVCFKYVIINALHTAYNNYNNSDNDNNNNNNVSHDAPSMIE